MKYSPVMSGPEYDQAVIAKNKRVLSSLLRGNDEYAKERADVGVFGERRLILSKVDSRSGLDSSTPDFVGIDPLAAVYENENAQMIAYAFSYAPVG